MVIEDDETSSSVEQEPVESPPAPHGPIKRHMRWSSGSLSDLQLPLTLTEALEHGVEQVFLCLRLGLRLWTYLGLGWRWTINLYRLMLYAALLLPGFLQMIVYYVSSPRVIRSIPYGRKPRQRLDLYVPKECEDGTTQVPVVVFVTGGAWTIGYKAWGALLGKRLCEQGVMCACLDYRNFPQGSALQMLEDVNTGIAWVGRHLQRYGGDPESVYLAGQSAGGQLSLLALLNQASQAAAGEPVVGASPAWHPLSVKAYIGISGAYDLEGLGKHLHQRGLYRNLLDTIMTVDGKVAYETLSPLHCARAASPALARAMPPCLFVHGTRDKSVPHAGSVLMHEALHGLNVPSTCQLYDGKTHTDFLLEDAMAGGRDLLSDSILSVICGREVVSNHPRMCPAMLVRVAGWVCPF